MAKIVSHMIHAGNHVETGFGKGVERVKVSRAGSALNEVKGPSDLIHFH